MPNRRFFNPLRQAMKTRTTIRPLRREVRPVLEQATPTPFVVTLASSTHGGGSERTGLASPAVGTRIGEMGRIELLQVIGNGGSAVVFKAHDHHLDRTVAVKFVREARCGDVPSCDPLILEARATARLCHENIVAVYDIGCWQQMPYILMEHVCGDALDARIAQRDLLPEAAVDVAIQVASAVEHAHASGVLHLDLKPSNVLVNARGRIKVIDFGIAGYLASLRAHSAVAQPSPPFVGTPAYMAPEQWSLRPLDERTDVWGLGAVLFEMLAGRPLEVRRSTTHGLFPSVERPFPDLTSELACVLRRALEARPEDRFATVSELLQSLRLIRAAMGATLPGSKANV